MAFVYCAWIFLVVILVVSIVEPAAALQLSSDVAVTQAQRREEKARRRRQAEDAKTAFRRRRRATSTVERRPSLYVVTPSYIKDLDQWANLMATVLSSSESSPAAECGFAKTVFTTIVSSDKEKQAFETRLSRIKSSCNTGYHRIDSIHIRTLHDVLLTTEPLVPNDLDKALEEVPGWDNKFLYQASKKFYGCLDAVGTTVRGSQSELGEGGLSSSDQGDVCFLLDSDSRMLRNNFCHLATEYMKKKTVLYSPYPNKLHHRHDSTIEYSRSVLKDSVYGSVLAATTIDGEEDDLFGEFFAMESYSWVVEVPLVQHFLQNVSIISALLGRDGPVPRDAYPEETYYHFLYPQRKALGYNFVDANDMIREIVGNTTFAQMWKEFKPGDAAFFEMLFERVGPLSQYEAGQIGRALREQGILQLRCSSIDDERVQTVMEYLDLCGSFYGRDSPVKISGISLNVPSCLTAAGLSGRQGRRPLRYKRRHA